MTFAEMKAANLRIAQRTAGLNAAAAAARPIPGPASEPPEQLAMRAASPATKTKRSRRYQGAGKWMDECPVRGPRPADAATCGCGDVRICGANLSPKTGRPDRASVDDCLNCGIRFTRLQLTDQRAG